MKYFFFQPFLFCFFLVEVIDSCLPTTKGIAIIHYHMKSRPFDSNVSFFILQNYKQAIKVIIKNISCNSSDWNGSQLSEVSCSFPQIKLCNTGLALASALLRLFAALCDGIHAMPRNTTPAKKLHVTQLLCSISYAHPLLSDSQHCGTRPSIKKFFSQARCYQG